MAKLISPRKFRKRYIFAERLLYLHCAQRMGLFWGGLFAAGLIVLAYNTKILFDQYEMVSFHAGAYASFYVIFFACIISIVISFVSLFLPARHQGGVVLFSVAAFWFTQMNRYVLPDNPVLTALGWVSFPLLVFLCALYLHWIQKHSLSEKVWIGVVAFSLVFWGVALGYNYLLLRVPGGIRIIGQFWSFRAQFLWVSVIILSFKKNLTDRDHWMLYIPLNSVRTMIWPEELSWVGDKDEIRRALWWNGAFNLLLGFSLMVARIQLDIRVRVRGGADLFILSVEHLLRTMGDVALLNIMIGMIRLYGFSVRDATSFVFLSRNPAAFWRRTSVYNFRFIQKYVYFPLLKWTQNRLLLISISFLVFYINYYGFWNFLAIFGKMLGFRSWVPHAPIKELFGQWLFFGISVLLIFLTPWIPIFNRRKGETALRAWASVLCNHAALIVAVYFSKKLWFYWVIHQ